MVRGGVEHSPETRLRRQAQFPREEVIASVYIIRYTWLESETTRDF